MRSPIWVTLLLAIGIAGCGGDSNSERSQLTLPGPKARVDHDAVAAGAWTVRASTVPAAIGPVVFAASDLRRAETTDSHPWLQHKPHDAATRSVTLYEGLPGMKRLRPGTYVFRHPVRFRVGITGSDTAERYTGVVKLVYEVKPRSY